MGATKKKSDKPAKPRELDERCHVQGPEAATDIELTPNKKGVLFGSFAGVYVADLATGKESIRYRGDTGVVSWMARMSSDGKRVVSAFGDITLQVWNAKTAKETYSAATHDRIITRIGLSRDGTRALTASGNNRLDLWDIARGKELGHVEHKKSFVIACALGGSGRYGAYGGTDGFVRVWDFDGQCERWAKSGKGWIESMDATADGAMYASTGRGKAILLWDAASGERVRTIELPANATEVSLSPDGRLVTAVTKSKKSPLVFDVATGKPFGVLEQQHPVVSARFSHDSTCIVTCDSAGTLRVFNVS